MSKDSKVIVLENHFEEARKAASGPQLLHALMAGGYVVQNWARMNIRSQDLIDTSRLINSIDVQPDPSASSGTVIWISIGTNVIYAAIHEFGGVIKAKAGKMLSWINDAGERVFAKAVHIPAKPYLRPALDEHEDDIKDAVGADLVDQIGKAVR